MTYNVNTDKKTHSRDTHAPEEEPVTIDTTDLLMTYNVNTDKKPL